MASSVTITPEQIAAVAKFLKPPLSGVALAVDKAGGKANVAALLDVSRPTVYHWSKVDLVPAEYVMALSHVSGMHPLELMGAKMRTLLDQIAKYK